VSVGACGGVENDVFVLAAYFQFGVAFSHWFDDLEVFEGGERGFWLKFKQPGVQFEEQLEVYVFVEEQAWEISLNRFLLDVFTRLKVIF